MYALLISLRGGSCSPWVPRPCMVLLRDFLSWPGEHETRSVEVHRIVEPKVSSYCNENICA